MAILPLPREPEIEDLHIRGEVRHCLELAQRAHTAAAAGDRLTAARVAVDLVRAYDKLLENIRLIPLPASEEKRVRDRLMPVTELLRRYKLR